MLQSASGDLDEYRRISSACDLFEVAKIMSQLAIFLLGSMQVTLDGTQAAGFVSKKAQALLAYLAVESSRSHGREELMGLLWPDYPSPSARTNLRSALYNVRRVIGDRYATPAFLHITRETIRFEPTSDQVLDLTPFDALPPSDKLDLETIRRLENAVAQCQGPFMAGFTLPDSPIFEEWALLKREYYGRQVSSAIQALATYYENSGGDEQALLHARRWVTLEPWQEEGHRQIMRLLAHNGQRSQALAHFETCRSSLATELGIVPSDETIILVEQIRSGNLANTSDLRPAPTVSAHLPVPLIALIGREVEQLELARLLADPGRRLICIVGPGGMGKTHLALVVASSQLQRFGDGVGLVLLAPLQSADGLVSAIAEALDFTFYENSPQEQQLLDYLSGKEILLVLDNFEHLLDGVPFIQRLLDAAPLLRIMATSRTRLEVHGEQLFPLEGLAYPAVEDCEQAGQSAGDGSNSAVDLFLENARRLRPNFRPSAGSPDMENIVRICRLMQGMPLGILLASTWIEVFSPREIVDEIERDFQFLQMDRHGLPERHQSLEAVFEHSWKLLSERERAVVRRFSIFRGGGDRDAILAVTEATLADLHSLTSKFLLTRNFQTNHSGKTGARYEIHELLRQFAAQKLSQMPVDEEAVGQCHCGYYTELLALRAVDLKCDRQMSALAEVEAEGENCRMAWQWAIGHQQWAQLHEALEGLGIFYEWRGRFEEGEAACRTALEALSDGLCSEVPDKKEPGDLDRLRLKIRLLGWQARFIRHLGMRPLAKQLAQRALHLLEDSALDNQNVRREQAEIMLEMGILDGYSESALDSFRQSLTLYQVLQNRWGMARSLQLLGAGLTNSPGTDGEGKDLCEQSYELFLSLGDRRSAGDVLGNLGFSAMLRGEHAKGETQLRQSLTMIRETSGAMDVTEGMASLATGLFFCGKFVESSSIADEHAQICRNLGDLPSAANTHHLMSRTDLYSGRYETALEHALQAQRLSQEMAHALSISYARWAAGESLLAQRAFGEAAVQLQESIAMHREENFLGRLKDVLTGMGFAAYGLNKPVLLHRCLVEALESCVDDRLWFTAVRSIALASLYAITQGRPKQAVELYALASSAPHVANSPWYGEVVGRHVAAAGELLPAKIFAIAQERGRSRDLWETTAEILASLKVDM